MALARIARSGSRDGFHPWLPLMLPDPFRSPQGEDGQDDAEEEGEAVSAGDVAGIGSGEAEGGFLRAACACGMKGG